MISVVYPYKLTESRELEWSLKSLKNIEHDNVFIIGDTPPYPVDATVIPDVPKPWSKQSRYHNQISKYLTACMVDEVGEDMILMNDDFFILQPTKLQNYNRGTLTDHIHSRPRDSYVTALNNTYRLFNTKEEPLSYELHVPMAVKKSLLRKAIEVMPLGKPVMIRSYYGNRYSIPSTYMEDVKNKEPGIFASTNERTFKGELGEKIREALS